MTAIPARSTLARYGLTETEWSSILASQGGVCGICGGTFDRLCIDHEHVRGWKKMTPANRKKYVRGLLCNYCNWKMLPKGMTLDRAKGVVRYLTTYES